MKDFVFLLIILSIIGVIFLVSSGDIELIIIGSVGGIYQIGLLLVLSSLLNKMEKLEARINKIDNQKEPQ